MSSTQSEGNLIVHGIKAKLAAMEHTAKELQTNKKMIETLRDTSKDDRVRMNATKLIFDIEKHITDMRWKMFEHENPAIQKSEITHNGLPEPPTRLEVVIVNATEKR